MEGCQFQFFTLYGIEKFILIKHKHSSSLNIPNGAKLGRCAFLFLKNFRKSKKGKKLVGRYVVDTSTYVVDTNIKIPDFPAQAQKRAKKQNYTKKRGKNRFPEIQKDFFNFPR